MNPEARMDGRMLETASQADLPWYVLQTKPRKEALVERNLAARGIPVLELRIVGCIRAGRHLQRRVQPMFPGYVLARIDVGSQAIAVRYVAGVKDFLRTNGEPQSLPQPVVDVLRERIGPKGIFEPPPPHFLPGDRVRIEEGPFQGLEAIFERELSGTERVAVLLASLQLAARVILPTRTLAAA